MVNDSEIYTLIGEEGFARLVRAFYAQVPGDAILSAMYPQHDLAGAELRLRDFMIGRFGGPDRYVQERGHPRLRQRHAPFVVNQHARDRWLALMNRALDEASLPESATTALRAFFEEASTFMINSD